jgi:hypothetical protein
MFSGMKVFNAGMSWADIPDFVHLWLALLAAGRVPRYVLIFLDPGMLNEKGISGQDWRSGKTQYQTFLASHHLTDPTSARPHAINELAQLEDLLNGALAWRSIAATLPDSPGAYLVWRLRRSDEFPSNDLPAYRFDGSLLYKRERMLPRADSIREEVPPVTDFDYQNYLNWSLSSDAVRLLFALISDMKAHNVEVSALLTPVSDPFHSRLQGTPGYQHVLSDFGSVLDRAEHAGLLPRACSVESVADAGCRRDEMLDFVHMLKPCVRKVLRYCAAKGDLSLPLAPMSESFY